MDNQNIQTAGDSAKQIGQIGQAETIDFGSITIEKDAISSAIISGDGNRVVIVRFDVASKKWEPLTDKVLRTKVHRFFNQYPSKRPCLSSPSNCAQSNLGVESKKESPAIKALTQGVRKGQEEDRTG